MAVVVKALSPSRRDPAVYRVDHARCIAGAVGGQKRHQVADLARVRRAAEWHALLEFLVAVLIAELVLGTRLQQRDVAVGANGPRIDADDADIVGEAFAAQRAGKR